MSGLHERPIGNAIWRAGAGAGKTYNLVERVLRIAEEWRKSSISERRQTFPRLVVTTFTRMATQELRVRLMEAALAAHAKGQPELIPFVTSRSQLFVTTMHGVMDSFLRSFGSEIGLEPGFRVASGDEMDTLMRRVGKRTLFPADGNTEAAADIDEILTEFDFATALRLIHRVSKIRLEFETSDTPTRPAVREDFVRSLATTLKRHREPLAELRGEIESHGPHEKWGPFVEWLSGAEKVLANVDKDLENSIEHLAAWSESEPKIVNSGKHKIDFGAAKDWKKPIAALEKEIESAAAEISSIDAFDRLNQAFSGVEKKFAAELRTEKFRSGLIELEDLELCALELIRKSPESAAAFAESWDHWLIDEFQDTSPRQVQLIAALAKGKPQFIVGDPQQSIYSFRGARPGVFSDREGLALTEGHEQHELKDNRRSSPGVMRFINHAVDRLGTEFHSMGVFRLTLENEGRKNGSIESPHGAATLLLLEPLTEIDAKGKEKALAVEHQRRREAVALSSAVSTILNSGASPASIAVLGRSNKELAIVAKEFARKGLPIQVHTAGAYSDRLEVLDLCSLLGFLANPHDDENLIHLARTPWFPVAETALALGYRRTVSLWNVLETAELEPESALQVQALQAALATVKERGLVQAFRETLSSCDFFSWCGILDPSGRREANTLKFLAKLSVAERQAGFTPRRFVDELIGGSDRGGESESSDRDAVAAIKPDHIHLMTIHVSKGLEFDHVFLPFATDEGKPQPLPNDFVFHEAKHIWSVGIVLSQDDGKRSAGPIAREWTDVLNQWRREETKRLLYVALTRARESLFISGTLASDAVPKATSFLGFLNLRIEAGAHGPYQTLHAIDMGVETKSLKSATPEIRLPWRKTESAKAKRALGNMSITALLEFEDRESARPLGFIDAAPSRVARPMSMAVAAARGTRLHRFFEMAKPMAGSGRESLQELMASEIARWFTGDEKEAASKALKWLLNLREPELREILQSGAVEWSFSYLEKDMAKLGTIALDGQIDLWGRDSRGQIWVLDYKTGSSEYSEKALRQLVYYAKALRAAGHAKSGEKLKLAALYPFSEEVITREWLVP